jgi:hypothetical protein
MSDNNYNPEYSDPINDTNSHEEVVTEKPYYDEVSAPAPQFYNNNNPPQDYNNDIPSKEEIQQVNQQNSSDVPYYSTQANNYNNNYNNTYNYNNQYDPNPVQPQPVRPRKYRMGENPRTLLILSILLIIIFIADLILEISFGIFSPLIMGDDFAILTMAIVYIVLIVKKKRFNHPALGAATVFVWFVGFGVKGFGMTQAEGKVGFMIPLFFLIAGRSFAMFFCIPHTCNNYSR